MNTIKINTISFDEIFNFHLIHDEDFNPKLSSRVHIKDYCEKLYNNANILSIQMNEELAGILAIYTNDNSNKKAFISSVCILRKYRGLGLSNLLLQKAVQLAEEQKMESINLEVGKENQVAITLYQKFGFELSEEKNDTLIMVRKLESLNESVS